jgi:hypothetical protein
MRQTGVGSKIKLRALEDLANLGQIPATDAVKVRQASSLQFLNQGPAVDVGRSTHHERYHATR